MKKTICILLAIVLCLCLFTCHDKPSRSESTETGITIPTTIAVESETAASPALPAPASSAPVTVPTVSTVPAAEPSAPIICSPDFTVLDIPAYQGSPYVSVHGGIPYFTDSDCVTEAFEYYADLDELGRCGTTYANVCQEIMPMEERGEIGQVKPSGWHTIRYNGMVDGNYLYNRCHLIGYQLAGENANVKNLITGTRYLNIEGMLPWENTVAEYVWRTDHHVLYRVTPIFEGDDLVARGVLMEGRSVEDDTICFCVFAFNVQPGIGIDYATGDSWLIEDPVATEAVTEPEETRTSTVTAGTLYIINTNTGKFHYPDCSSVDDMKEKNKQEYTGSRDDLIAQGYSPCGRCKP